MRTNRYSTFHRKQVTNSLTSTMSFWKTIMMNSVIFPLVDQFLLQFYKIWWTIGMTLVSGMPVPFAAKYFLRDGHNGLHMKIKSIPLSIFSFAFLRWRRFILFFGYLAIYNLHAYAFALGLAWTQAFRQYLAGSRQNCYRHLRCVILTRHNLWPSRGCGGRV